MALSGLHVVCGLAGGNSKAIGGSGIALLGRAVWSETLASAGTTTQEVPQGEAPGTYVLSIRSSADAWVSIGTAPNATTGTRRLVPASTDVDVFANAGDKVAWMAA